MLIEVHFLQKCNSIYYDQKIHFKDKSYEVSIEWNHEDVFLNVETSGVYDGYNMVRALWEICSLYDGYFYKVESILEDGKEKSASILYSLNYYSSASEVITSSRILNRGNRTINKKVYDKYVEYRNSRSKGKLFRELFNAYYYITSESYSNVLIDHRLALLLNVCDGLMINAKNSNASVEKNIKNVLSLTDVKTIKIGFSYFGLSKSSLYSVLSDVRNEISHFSIKEHSLNSAYYRGEVKSSVFLYIYYVIKIALRVNFLELIGADVDKDAKDHAIAEIALWAGRINKNN